MTIRLATLADLPVLARLVEYAADELAEKFDTPRMGAGVTACIKHGLDTHQAVVVAEQQGEVIGWCARVSLPGLPEGQVEGLGTWVAEKYRRDGVAREMREFADEQARIRGAKFVTGIATKGNIAGIESCLAEGYKIAGFLMRKELTNE